MTTETSADQPGDHHDAGQPAAAGDPALLRNGIALPSPADILVSADASSEGRIGARGFLRQRSAGRQRHIGALSDTLSQKLTGTDALGSLVAVIDAAGNVIEQRLWRGQESLAVPARGSVRKDVRAFQQGHGLDIV